MFFLSVVPVIATQSIEVFAATRLLFRRSEQNVKVLRGTLVALVVASASAVAIDLSYFRDDPGFIFDVITCVFAIIWALYFWKSERVKSVFVNRNWSFPTESKRRLLTTDDKRDFANEQS
jgi:hypothetical protein